jgi:hypothetical protein
MYSAVPRSHRCAALSAHGALQRSAVQRSAVHRYEAQ